MKKNEVICLVAMFPELWSLIYPKKMYFLQFCADLSKKLKPVQPIYILKVLTTLFQKMIWFIGFWATVHEILAIKISKEILSDPGEI